MGSEMCIRDSSYTLMLVLTDEEYVVAALRIPKGNGDGTVAPSLGGTEAVLGGGGGAATSSAMAADCEAPTSTNVGVARRAALRRSTRACRARWPERLLRRGGGAGVSRLALGGRSSVS